MTRDVTLDDEPADVLDALEASGDTETVDALEGAIELVVQGSRIARRHRLTAETIGAAVPTWVVPVRVRGRGWVVVWESIGDAAAKVVAIGPSDHRF